MDTLDSFIRDDLPRYQRDIGDIDKLLSDSEGVYATQFDNSVTAWPYEVSASGKGDIEKLSHNTTAMILAALLRLTDRIPPTDIKSVEYETWPRSAAEERAQLLENVNAAAKLLLDDILDSGNPKLTLKSGTFGDDDVFTMAWLATVSQAKWNESEDAERWRIVSSLIFDWAKTRLQDDQSIDIEKLFDPRLGNVDSKSTRLDHAFQALRLVQIFRRIKGNGFGPLGACSGFFEARLHQQLSFSSIPDSRFDPAELAFCLEGMLQSQRDTVDPTVFERVVKVLTDVQSESAFWRPVRPYIAQQQGLVLFPVSVEIANSLMRSCFIYDRKDTFNTFGSRCIPLLSRYWQWLRARTVRFPEKNNSKRYLTGWHSEHVNDVSLIHMWETSQVVEFLLAFRNLLSQHVAHTSLLRSRLSAKDFLPKAWDAGRDPVTSLGSDLRIFDRIESDFIAPRTGGRAVNTYSMLLFGPPGTGKTTIAEDVAAALGQRFITLTVSDFLEQGPAQIEARAKNLFTVLMVQSPCVVLFDEIDHFLLDRDSERYRKQETLFQFMTPGMLTKLADLRRLNRILFVVATNYEDRIDAAIKRTGRIDRSYLVLPPGAEQRGKLLETLVKTHLGDEASKFDAMKNRLIAASVFLGWKDIKEAVGIVKSSPKRTLESLLDRLTNWSRSCSLTAYQGRFDGVGDVKKTPIGEFLCLLALMLEVPRPLDERETQVVQIVATLLGGAGSITADVVRTFARDLDVASAERVAAVLKKLGAIK